MNTSSVIKALAPLLIGPILLGGCTAKINYYLMSPIAGSEPPTQEHKAKLGVGPIQLADYLQRQNVVTRTSSSRIEVPREHKWGSSLESHITETLAENLRQRLGLKGVVVYPWQPGTTIDHQLTADFIQFIYQESAVILEANWILRKRSTGQFVDGFSRISEPSTDDYDDVVDAMSRALGKMSDQIAMKVQQPSQWKSK